MIVSLFTVGGTAYTTQCTPKISIGQAFTSRNAYREASFLTSLRARGDGP
jgi:hypothetical protein